MRLQKPETCVNTREEQTERSGRPRSDSGQGYVKEQR